MVERLKVEGQPEATQHVRAAMGYYQSVAEGARCQFKRIVISPVSKTTRSAPLFGTCLMGSVERGMVAAQGKRKLERFLSVLVASRTEQV
jgi:hypothetical protein